MKINERYQAVADALYLAAARELESIEASFGLPVGNSGDKAPSCVIVDAEADASTALAECLAARGIKAWASPSGEEALGIIRQVRPALVLLDLKSEGISGLQLLARVRRVSPRSRIIILTGWTFPYIEAVTREFQVDAYYLKPVSVETVLQVVGKTLDDLSLIGNSGV